MKLLEGKTALITGATRGIGRSIAIKFAEQGANVAFSYANSEEKANQLVEEIVSKGGKAVAYKSDAADYISAENLVKSVIEKFGGLHVIVNNAGITRDGLLMRMSESNWDEVINTNLKSVFNITKAAQAILLKQRNGSIINLSSVVGVKGNKGQSNYAASKAGIIGFTKSVALELGSRNIRCNAIAPGFIHTEMTDSLPADTVKQWTDGIPLKRAGTADDVANLAVFLASDMSSYITGQVISICGGMST